LLHQGQALWLPHGAARPWHGFRARDRRAQSAKALGRNDGKLPPRRYARPLGRDQRRARRPIPTQPPRRPGLLLAPCTDATARDREYFVEVSVGTKRKISWSRRSIRPRDIRQNDREWCQNGG